MAARPLVNVYDANNAIVESVKLPGVFRAPLRADVVQFVHTQINKNNRQAYAVDKIAGTQTPAESWGTGRAVSRIPRVGGGGTHRSGQGAFGNMCRGGRMFAPTKVWRKWHRKVTSNQRRYAVCSALAASAVPALVMARGHRIEQTAEIPLVLSTAATQGIAKTKQAVALLTALNVIDDVEHVKSSRKIRAGRGKIRNRRYVQRKGPLVVYKEASPFLLALRNIPGVEVADVSRLNLLQLAPGGHLGRFIVWVQDAFESLDDIFGNERRTSKQKKGYRPPRHIMANADVPRLLNSEEVKSSLRPAGSAKAPFQCQKRNPLKNYGAYLKLNPAAAAQKRKLINNLNAKKAAGKKTQKKRARNVDRSVAKKNLLA